MKQSRDVGQKPHFGPNLGLNGPILGSNLFLTTETIWYHLEIIIAYHYVQNTQNLMSRSRENEFGDKNKNQDHSIMFLYNSISREVGIFQTCGFRTRLTHTSLCHFQ